ncbi:MAG: DEAD/DEAH box helicase [Alphaproteobacteria bacterium]|nr:DEAD/DEAH box helicase [Alphaproteobacteria bacterium]
MSAPLPVDAILPDLARALASSRSLVLQAPPGTGKTTRVPTAVARCVQGRVVVLEPRRMAARAAARRVAGEWGTPLGQDVGYQVRGDAKRSDRTRVLFVTEGVFLRQATADPFLDGVGAVVLDEVHERSLDADLALALVRSIQQGLREDLVVVAMSATLDAAPLARFLDAEVLTATAPLHPLEVRFDPRPDGRPLEDRVADAISEVRGVGDVLAFLPGVPEIWRTARRMGRPVLELHGRLTGAEQDAVLRGGSGGRVILSTNVAESSVTVPGVRAVVDAGLARIPRLDLATGLEVLEVQPIARDAAEQRAGRAAREGPGVVRRLWTARDDRDRPSTSVPAIRRSDLAPTVLRLLAFGEPDPRSFPWFEDPPPGALDAALELLELLGATRGGALTPLGERLAGFPLHPRLGRFVLEAEARGAGRRAAALALWLADGGRPEGELVDARPPEVAEASRLARSGTPEPDALERAALAGWPDRLARTRGEGAVMVGGTGVVGGHHALFVALGVHPSRRGDRGEALVTLQSRVEPEWLEASERVVHRFEDGRVRAFRQQRAGALVLAEHPAPVDPHVAAETLFREACRSLDRVVPDDPDLHEILGRLRFISQCVPFHGLPSGGADDTLLPALEVLCRRHTGFGELRKAPWRGTILDALPWNARQHLDANAPERVTLASGNTARITYAGDVPVLAARIQHLMGTRETPRVGGRPVLLHLLAPNGRPQQITDDLAGFWANTYHDVRKDLRARYPKHPWPEDPTVVPPKRR